MHKQKSCQYLTRYFKIDNVQVTNTESCFNQNFDLGRHRNLFVFVDSSLPSSFSCSLSSSCGPKETLGELVSKTGSRKYVYKAVNIADTKNAMDMNVITILLKSSSDSSPILLFHFIISSSSAIKHHTASFDLTTEK